MEDTLSGLNPAAIQGQIQASTAALLTLTTGKAAATLKPRNQTPHQARIHSRVNEPSYAGILT
jgi:hypothetical protein